MPAAFVRTRSIAHQDRHAAQNFMELLRSGAIESASLVVERSQGRSETVPISASLIEAIAEYVSLIPKSKQIGIFTDDPEVTPEQAAELLGMSRPTVVQRIRQGDIKARMVGAHHRILMSEVLAFLSREDEQKAVIADRLVREDSVRFAVASTVMEGGTVSPETEALLESWSQGEIDDDELIVQTLQGFLPGA